jgi:hypothetical protein
MLRLELVNCDYGHVQPLSARSYEMLPTEINCELPLQNQVRNASLLHIEYNRRST